MVNEQGKTQINKKIELWIDFSIFVAFLVAMDPRSSGKAIHEWLTVSMAAVIVVHLLLSWDWIVKMSRRFFSKMGGQARLNYALNWLLFITGTLLIISGIMISQKVVPSLGIVLPQSFTWRELHNISANLSLILLGLHTALHWGWIADTFKKYIFQPIGRMFSANSKKDEVA